MENGSKVRIEAEETYYGLPATVTKDFVEIIDLSGKEGVGRRDLACNLPTE
ncbi:MAG: hypothetical protein F6K35_11855 [Okeania sp. SIO2H7]|nr:hypothetical protein [Okeania sp. SIO2H7]